MIFRHKDALLLFFLGSLAFRNVWLGPATVTQLTLGMTYTIGIVGLLVSPRKKGQREAKPVATWVALAAVFCTFDVLSATIHDSVEIAAQTLKARVGAMLSFTLPILLYSRSTNVEKCHIALIVAATIASIAIVSTSFGIFDFSEFGGRTTTQEVTNFAGEALPRTSGILNDFGDIAILFAFVMPWITLPRRSFSRLLLLLPLLAILLLGAFLPLSRNVWLVCGLTQLLSLFFYMRLNSRQATLRVFILSIAAVVSSILIVINSREIYTDLMMMRQASSDIRMLQYSMAVEVFGENFLLGTGVEDCVLVGHPIHNALLLSACRTGLLGAVPLSVLYLLNFIGLAVGAFGFRPMRSASEQVAVMSFFVAYCGFVLSTMLFPAGTANASEIFWGLMGLFSAISIDMFARSHMPYVATRKGRASAARARPFGGANLGRTT